MKRDADAPVLDLSKNPYLSHEGLLKAEARGRTVLLLYKMSGTYQRSDGRRVSWRLVYRWLSADPTEKGDEVCCVEGDEFTYWSRRELNRGGALKKGVGLFQALQLY
jgi:hypothetical protein